MSTNDVMWVIHALILVNNARKSMLKYIVFVYLLSKLFWSAESQVTKTCLVTILIISTASNRLTGQIERYHVNGNYN